MIPARVFLLRFAPNKDYVGKTISQIAAIRKSTDAETLQRLVADASLFEENNTDYSSSIEGIMGKAMSEEDLKTFYPGHIPMSVLMEALLVTQGEEVHSQR